MGSGAREPKGRRVAKAQRDGGRGRGSERNIQRPTRRASADANGMVGRWLADGTVLEASREKALTESTPPVDFSSHTLHARRQLKLAGDLPSALSTAPGRNCQAPPSATETLPSQA